MPAQAERAYRIILLQRIIGNNLSPEELNEFVRKLEAGWREEGELKGQPLDVDALSKTLDK